jgi:hypothetical protein
MENAPEKKPEHEQTLVKLYTELTGSKESEARAVIMHLELIEPEVGQSEEPSDAEPIKPGPVVETP